MLKLFTSIWACPVLSFVSLGEALFVYPNGLLHEQLLLLLGDDFNLLLSELVFSIVVKN